MRALPVTRQASNFELYSWLFQRVSAILILFLVLIHFGIMHLITTVDSINYAFVASRFATPFWRTYDLLLLVLGLTHGMNGGRVLVDDYVHTRSWRLVCLATLYTVGFVVLAIGALVLFTFQPVEVR